MKYSILTCLLLILFSISFVACDSDKKPATDQKDLGSQEVDPVSLTGQIKDIITNDNLDGVIIRDSRGMPIDTTGPTGEFTAFFLDGNSRKLGFSKNGKNTMEIDFIRLDNLIRVVLYMENAEGESPEIHYIRGTTTQPDSIGFQDLNSIVVEEVQTRTYDTTNTSGWYVLSSSEDKPDLNYFYDIISTSQRDSIQIDFVHEIRDSIRMDVVLNDKVTGINIKKHLH